MKLYLFGSLRIVQQNKTRTLTGNTAALLGYLGLHNRPMLRTTIAGTLFPNVPEAQARRLLTQTLYRLRREIDVTSLVVDSAMMTLQDVWIDVVAFQELGEQGHFTDALDLYTGDLLTSVDADWVLGSRALLREQFLQWLEAQIGVLMTANEIEKSLLLAKRWVQVNPLDESAHVRVMQLYARLGKQSAAQQQYDALATLLDDELGVAPLPSTTAVMEEIGAQFALRRLIGRKKERAQLLTHLTACTAVFLEGAAGIGKTHLINDVAAALRWRSISVAMGKADAVAQAHPYAPLIVALRDAVQNKPHWLTQMTPMAGRIIDMLLSTTPTALSAPTSARALQMAIHQLLKILTAEQPMVFVFDDVQWADQAFWTVLPTLVAAQSVGILLTFRSHEMRADGEGWAVLSAIEQEYAPVRIVLAGFSERETTEFTKSHGHTLSKSQLHHLQKTSQGNPYLLREMLRTEGATEIDTLRDQRLATLSAQERTALDALSVVGQAVSAETWHTLLAFPPPIKSLLTKEFIISEYRFEHDLLRLHVYNALSDDERKRWHRRAVSALKDEATAATLAWHFAEAGDIQAAIEHYQMAAEVALSLSDFATARRMAGRAEAIGEDELQLRILQLQVIEAARFSSVNLAEMEALEALAKADGEQTNLLRLLRLRLKALSARGDVEAVRAIAEEAVMVSRSVGNISAEIEIHLAVANQIVTTERDLKTATEWVDHALKLAEDGPPHLLAEALLVKSQIYARQPDREVTQLNGYHERVASLIAKHRYLRPMQTDLLFDQAIAAQVSGDLEKAWLLWCQVADIYEREGADRPLRSARYNAAHTSMILGQHEEAILFAEALMQAEYDTADKQDRYYVNQFRALLIDVYTMAGELASAEIESHKLLLWLTQEPEGHAARHAWNSIGSFQFYRGDYEAAFNAHSRALVLIPPHMQTTAAPFLYICEVAFKLGRLEEARDYLAKSAERLAHHQPTSNSIFYHYLDYHINRELSSLVTAREELFWFAQKLSSPQLRHDYLYRLPFQRDILSAWRQAFDGVRDISLTAAEHPVGKIVTDADRRRIEWTVDAGVLDKAFSAENGKVALRHHRLQRLIHEANVQGTTPTQIALATALNVTPRTIQRDVAALAKQGVHLQTRQKL